MYDLPVHSQQELAQLLWTIKLQDPQACPLYQDYWLKKTDRLIHELIHLDLLTIVVS